MRGSDEQSGSLFSYVDLEARVRGDHPPFESRRRFFVEKNPITQTGS
jgi:hypothetical protein